jgi:hypothetical protein
MNRAVYVIDGSSDSRKTFLDSFLIHSLPYGAASDICEFVVFVMR